MTRRSNGPRRVWGAFGLLLALAIGASMVREWTAGTDADDRFASLVVGGLLLGGCIPLVGLAQGRAYGSRLLWRGYLLAGYGLLVVELMAVADALDLRSGRALGLGLGVFVLGVAWQCGLHADVHRSPDLWKG